MLITMKPLDPYRLDQHDRDKIKSWHNGPPLPDTARPKTPPSMMRGPRWPFGSIARPCT
jgi:hypothetical protein